MATEPDAVHPSDAAEEETANRELDPHVRLDLAEERLLHAAGQRYRSDRPELDPDTEAALRRRLTRPDDA